MTMTIPVYKIAGLRVAMQPQGAQLIKQCAAYREDRQLMEIPAAGLARETAAAAVAEPACDMVLRLPDGFLDQQQREYPCLTRDDCEYIWLGALFYRQLLTFDGFLLHASAIAVNHQANLFSASSGVGKSTHTGLWSRTFGSDLVQYINDDKPAIRLEDGCFWVYGTPFSGKTDLNRNLRVPLNAICLLERSGQNWIRRVTSQDAFALLCQQTYYPDRPETMEQLLTLFDRLLQVVPVYQLGCDMSEDAVRLAHAVLSREPPGL